MTAKLEPVQRGSKRKLLHAMKHTGRICPWNNWPMPGLQKKSGIDVLIFRGSNRNKRRGAHNTWRLYRATRDAAHITFKDALESGK